MYTLPVSLANLMLEHTKDPELMMAGSVVTYNSCNYSLSCTAKILHQRDYDGKRKGIVMNSGLKI